MARTLKMIFMEKKVVRSLYTMEHACLVCRSSEYLTQGCGGLSLSPLVTDPAASRPPGEGSAVASLSLTIGHLSGRIPSAGGKGGSASFLCSTVPRKHVPICATRHSL